MPYKLTKTHNRFSKLISGNESSSKRSSLIQLTSSSSKRNSSTQLTSSSSKRARNEKVKAPESVPDNIPDSNLSASTSEKKRAEEDLDVSHLEEKLDTILKQNSMIIKNIDKLLLFQENLEDRIEDMNSLKSNSNNKTFINVIKSFFNIFITTCLIYAYMLTFSFN